MNNKKNILIVVLVFVFGIFIGSFLPKFVQIEDWSKKEKGMADCHMMCGGGMGMDNMMSDMTSGLQGKTGDVFDKAFIDEMIIHHKGAVEMANLVLKNSKREELRVLAKDIVSAQSKEISMMQSWRSSWFR